MTTSTATTAEIPVLVSDVELTISTRAGRVIASSGFASIVESAALADGLHHVAVVINGSTFELFVDGGTWGADSFSDVSTSPLMTLGLGNADPIAVGVIDELRVWARALSTVEIEAIAAQAF